MGESFRPSGINTGFQMAEQAVTAPVAQIETQAVAQQTAKMAAEDAAAADAVKKISDEESAGVRRRRGRASTILTTSPAAAVSGARSRTTLGI